MSNDNALLEVKNLKTHFYTDDGIVKAVDGVDFTLRQGTTLGIVGESGCGKSVTAQSILRIVPSPGKVVAGQVLYHAPHGSTANGHNQSTALDLTQLPADSKAMRSIRGAEISMIFQEPMTALSPVHKVGNQIVETIMLHQNVSKSRARQRAIDILRQVGMPQPESVLDSYRDQLSGGMRQRAMIAIALSCDPALLIADEPTTALDVTVEAQILALIRQLQRERGMAIVYISHNLGVIAQITQEVIIMYLGRVVEHANVVSIFHNAKHPYTQLLLKSIPRLGHKSDELLAAIEGSVPDPLNMPPGCAFHPRCPFMKPGICEVNEPELIDVGQNHSVRCVLYE